MKHLLLSTLIFPFWVSSAHANLSNLKYFGVADHQEPTEQTAVRLSELAKLSNLSVVGPRVMANEDLNRAILLSLRKLNPEYQGRLLKHPRGISVQMKIGSEDVALFFVGYQEAEVAKIQADFNHIYASNRGPASEAVGGTSTSSAGASAAGGSSYARQLFESFKGCGAGLIKGFNAVTVDPFISAGKSLKGLSEIGWAKYWENSVGEYDKTVAAVKNYEKTIAKGVTSYASLSVEEKSAFNCSLAGGAGVGGVAVKAAQKVASRAVVLEPSAAAASSETATASAVKTSVRTESETVIAARESARARLAARENLDAMDVKHLDFVDTQPTAVRGTTAKSPPSPQPSSPPARPAANDAAASVEGLSVREWNPVPPSKDIVPVTVDEFIKINGNFDPSKVRYAPEPPKQVSAKLTASNDKYYRSIIDVGHGNMNAVVYKVISTKKSGKVVIEFENPLRRGQLETREVFPGELRRGYQEVAAPARTAAGGF